MEGLYATGDKRRPWHHFLVAAQPTAELGNDTVALVANVAQCLAPHAMMLSRERWEGTVLLESGRPTRCAVRRAGRFGGRVPRTVGDARCATLDRPAPLGP